MRRVRAHHQVALLRARRHAGRRTGALHVDDHRRDLGVVREADELVHQRDARTRGRRERARARPRCADDHAECRQFVFRLEDRELLLLRLRIAAVLHAEALEGFHHRRRRRDRVPCPDRRPRVHRAKRRGGVAVDQDAVLRRIHLLEMNRQRALEVRLRVVVAERDRLLVGIEQRLLGGVLLFRQRGDDLGVHADQRCQRAGIGDVLHQDALAHALERRVAHLGQRHAEIRHIGTLELLVERPRRVEHQVAARSDLADILCVGRGIERHHQVEGRRPRGVAVLVDADLVPRRQALDVRREHVLARHRHAHAEDGLHDQAVRAGRTRAVGGRNFEGEIINARQIVSS